MTDPNYDSRWVFLGTDDSLGTDLEKLAYITVLPFPVTNGPLTVGQVTDLKLHPLRQGPRALWGRLALDVLLATTPRVVRGLARLPGTNAPYHEVNRQSGRSTRTLLEALAAAKEGHTVIWHAATHAMVDCGRDLLHKHGDLSTATFKTRYRITFEGGGVLILTKRGPLLDRILRETRPNPRVFRDHWAGPRG